MNFLIPGAFGLASLLLVIVALYLLKLRRTEHTVSSLYLWRQMVQDRQASAPWQRLHFNWLMILQLLFLAILVIALARPFFWRQGISGQAVILILDSSASMSASDIEPSRIVAACKRARQIINDLPDDVRLTIIEAGSETKVHLTSSLDRAQALQVVDALQPGTGSADLGMALELASAVASRNPDTRIVLLSDGRSPLPNRLALRGSLDYIPIGIDNNNQAISLINIESSAAGGWTVFVQVSNYSSQGVERRLDILADDQLMNAYDLKLDAGGQQSVVMSNLPQDVQRIEAKLEGSDALNLDDRAFSAVRRIEPRRVALVSKGNLFLKTALSLLPGVVLTEVDLSDDQTIENADITIFDAILPQVLPKQGSLWFIAPERSTDLFSISGGVKEPTLRLFDAQDAVMRNVSLSGVHLLDAAQLTLPDWATPMLVGDVGGVSFPMMFRGEPSGRRVAVLAFDVTHSDLPLNVAFPVLCANLIEWLAPGTQVGIPVSIMPGELVLLPDGIRQAEITLPDGSTQRAVTDENRLSFSDTYQLGFYKINWDEEHSEEFAVNLFSPQESDIATAQVLPGLTSQLGENAEQPTSARREVWRWLALPALLMLMIEWMVYQHSGVKRFRDWLVDLMKNAHHFHIIGLIK